MHKQDTSIIKKREFLKMAMDGLESQGWKQSLNERDSCMFDGPNGRHCGVGFILKELKLPVIKSAKGTELDLWMQIKDTDLRSYQDFLVEIQDVHDFNGNPETMKEEFEILKKNLG